MIAREPASGRRARRGRQQSDRGAERVRALTNGSSQPAAEQNPSWRTGSNRDLCGSSHRSSQSRSIDNARQQIQIRDRQHDEFRGGFGQRDRIRSGRFTPGTVRAVVILFGLSCFAMLRVSGTATLHRNRRPCGFTFVATRPAIERSDNRGDNHDGRQPTQQQHSQHITHRCKSSHLILRRQAAIREEEFQNLVTIARCLPER